jgi:hypothetical protein
MMATPGCSADRIGPQRLSAMFDSLFGAHWQSAQIVDFRDSRFGREAAVSEWLRYRIEAGRARADKYGNSRPWRSFSSELTAAHF